MLFFFGVWSLALRVVAMGTGTSAYSSELHQNNDWLWLLTLSSNVNVLLVCSFLLHVTAPAQRGKLSTMCFTVGLQVFTLFGGRKSQLKTYSTGIIGIWIYEYRCMSCCLCLCLQSCIRPHTCTVPVTSTVPGTV